MTKDVGKYVDRYNMYQWMKNRTETPVEKLIVNKVLKKLWMYWIIDFITNLPLVAKKDTILVICNRLSKIAHFIATIKEILVERSVRLFRDNI